MIELIKELRHRVIEYMESEMYLKNESTQIYVARIFIAISLSELAFLESRAISVEEEYWFKGDMMLLREFDNDVWGDIFTTSHLKNNKMITMQARCTIPRKFSS